MQKTKCDFCQYKLGTDCVAAEASGRVSEHKCRQANYEYNKWLQEQKRKQQAKHWHSWH